VKPNRATAVGVG